VYTAVFGGVKVLMPEQNVDVLPDPGDELHGFLVDQQQAAARWRLKCFVEVLSVMGFHRLEVIDAGVGSPEC